MSSDSPTNGPTRPIITGHEKLPETPYMATSLSVHPGDRWQVVVPLDRWDEGTISELQNVIADHHAGVRDAIDGVPPVGSTG